MIPSLAQRLVNQNYPPVPSLIPIYKTVQTTTTDETTTSFTFNLGTPHPDRHIFVTAYHGVAAACTCTLDGYASMQKIQNAAHEFSIHVFCMPDNRLSGTVSVSATGSLRKAVAVFVAYPRRMNLVAGNTATANTTTNASASLSQFRAGWYAVYVGGQHATAGAFGTTRTGCIVTESVDAQLVDGAATASYTMGYFVHDPAVGSSGNNALVLAETVSGTKRLVYAIVDAARPSSGVAGTAEAYY